MDHSYYKQASEASREARSCKNYIIVLCEEFVKGFDMSW